MQCSSSWYMHKVPWTAEVWLTYIFKKEFREHAEKKQPNENLPEVLEAEDAFEYPVLCRSWPFQEKPAEQRECLDSNRTY